MGNSKRKKPGVPDEKHLVLPCHPHTVDSTIPVVLDTHTHLLSTYRRYRSVYSNPRYDDIFSFVREMYGTPKEEPEIPRYRTVGIVDVWCEAPVIKAWKELADSSLSASERDKRWGGVEYWFVMGVHPHDVENYSDDVEREILAAMEHPRCVGWGEIGLDYKLRHAVRLGKPITIHTREAEDDTERILKAVVPKDHPMHIHCFTDSPGLALRLIDYFPNLYIGITGVITYTTNVNTTNFIRALVGSPALSLRILLETDAPYMIPSNVYRDVRNLSPGSKLPISHTGMIPWTAEWVAKVAADEAQQNPHSGDRGGWTIERVLSEARENADCVWHIV